MQVANGIGCSWQATTSTLFSCPGPD